MTRPHLITVSLATTAALLCSCGSTTGDPRQGGLFGWSQEQALQRQLELKTIEAAKKNELAETQKTGESLLQKQIKLLKEIKKLQEKAEATTQSAEKDRLRAEIAKRQKELSSLGN
ncbi:MAG: hypothetical protein IKJ29_04505 [Akkermansia sp.]|nr:hypothetical protein [Akkermansia sp.]